ncbi:unnamed protein product [Closterium sp. NIES-65]|nr:unnamed protein product [Closterium sp. NIES-65]CAI6006005.1 unnamed protein product [Closterium sp. NIES-65]
MSTIHFHERPLSIAARPSLSTHRHVRPSAVFLGPRTVNGGKEITLRERKLARARNQFPLQVSRGGQGNRVHCSATNNGQSSTAAGAEDWVARYADALRLLPLAAGAAGGAVVLVNRVVWGIPAVADAGSARLPPFPHSAIPLTARPSGHLAPSIRSPSFACRFSASAQARADVICLVLAASMVLSGLSWLALRPKPQTPVVLNGVPCHRMLPSLPQPVQQELNWAWTSLNFNTPCCSLVIIFKGQCILQVGSMTPAPNMPGVTTAATVDAEKLLSGSICSTVLKSGRPNYLANLILFPARYELFEFLPDNTQVWLGSIAEKLDASLSALLEQG